MAIHVYSKKIWQWLHKHSMTGLCHFDREHGIRQADFDKTLSSDLTRMETPAHSSAMDEDELIFDRYSKTAIRSIKDPIYDQSMVTSSPYTTRSLAFALVPICLTLSRFIDTYVILGA
jgi:hypothetical protein